MEEPELLKEGEPTGRTGRSAVSGYARTYPEYGETFGCSARTVKRWVKIGKDADDACPLDEPGRMRAWWSRCMRLRCPDGVLAAEIAAGGRKSVPVEEPELPPMMLESEERGLAGALARLEQLEVKLAGRADQPGQADPWLRTVARMTALATKLRQELEAQGKLVPKQEVAAEIKSFHGQIVSVLKAVLPPEGVREVFELLQQEVFAE